MDIKKKMFMHVLFLMLFTDFTLKICKGYTEMVIGGLFYHLFRIPSPSKVVGMFLLYPMD